MARVFAKFEEHRLKFDGEFVTPVVRTDTRIYFGEQHRVSRNSGRCIGALFLQNPGSASPESASETKGGGLSRWPWGEVSYYQEDLIPLVIDVLDDVLTKVCRANAKMASALQRHGYVQLLNLSYVKNPPNAKDKFKEAMKQWKRLLESKRCRDDVPDAGKQFRFIVFGWGSVFGDGKHGERVSQSLASYLPGSVHFVFPKGSNVTTGKRVASELACRTAVEIRQQIKQSACYPCGMRRGDVRAVFPGLYRKAVSSCLARILLGNQVPPLRGSKRIQN